MQEMLSAHSAPAAVLRALSPISLSHLPLPPPKCTVPNHLPCKADDGMAPCTTTTLPALLSSELASELCAWAAGGQVLGCSLLLVLPGPIPFPFWAFAFPCETKSLAEFRVFQTKSRSSPRCSETEWSSKQMGEMIKGARMLWELHSASTKAAP